MKSRQEVEPLTRILAVICVCALGIILIHAGFVEYTDDKMGTAPFFEKFRRLTPNEMGDAIAGVFSSLAFLAAVGALLFQRKELVEQRREFTAQRVATEGMAEAMSEQLILLKDERIEREFAKSKATLDELVNSIDEKVREIERYENLFVAPKTNSSISNEKFEFSFFKSEPLSVSSDKLVGNLLRHYLAFLILWNDQTNASKPEKYMKMREYHAEILELLGRISELHELLSPDQKIRYERLNIQKGASAIRKVLARPIWAEDP